MHIIDYQFKIGTEQREGYVAIPGLDPNESSTTQFMDLMNLNIKLTKPTAFLYVGGVTLSACEGNLLSNNTGNYIPVIKMELSQIAHQWVGVFENPEWVQYIGVMTGTCAAGIQAISEAQRLFDTTDLEEIIIIGCERTSPDTLRLFSELGIAITCGEGCFYLHLSKEQLRPYIDDVKWKWKYSSNPFFFDCATLDELIPRYNIDYVKLHGTGTPSNDAAEANLEALCSPIKYKPEIGHTQGISALIETCMVLDDATITGDVLVTANGLGGYYGAFTLHK